jgi:hypothetical protein
MRKGFVRWLQILGPAERRVRVEILEARPVDGAAVVRIAHVKWMKCVSHTLGAP